MMIKLIIFFVCVSIAPLFSFSVVQEQSKRVRSFREKTEGIYEKKIKIIGEDKLIKSDENSFIDPYGMRGFGMENRKYDLSCYFRNSMDPPCIFFLSGEKIYLFKGASPECTNLGYMEKISGGNIKSFYWELFFMNNESKLSDEQIQEIFDFIKRAYSYKKISFSFEIKQKKLTSHTTVELIKTWNFLKAHSISSKNKIEAFESVFPILDANNSYSRSDGSSYFEEQLLLHRLVDNRTETEIEDLFNLKSKESSSPTVYELGLNNKTFGIALPSALYSKGSVPHLAVELVDFIKNEVDNPQTKNFEEVLLNKLSCINERIAENNNSCDTNISYFYKKMEDVFNNEYKISFPNSPVSLAKDSHLYIYDSGDHFDRNISRLFQGMYLKNEDIFCFSNNENQSLRVFFLKKNIITFFQPDETVKNKMVSSLNNLKKKMESIAFNNDSTDPKSYQRDIGKIISILNKYRKQEASLKQCLERKEIEIPSEIAELIRDIWSQIADSCDKTNNVEIYKTHFPQMFPAAAKESYFQNCMKKEGFSEIVSPSHFMISTLGYKGEFFALNLPSCFYLDTEIPYQINKVLTQIYLLNSSNSKENQEVLKKYLIELKNNFSNSGARVTDKNPIP